MKRIFNSFMAIAVAALAIVSCAKADQVELQEPEEGYRYSFTVVDDFSSTKGDTKAILGTTGVVWEEHDRVGMFLTGYTGYANIDMTKTPKEVVLYSTQEIPADSYAYSYYPYATSNSDKTNTKISLSNVQTGGTSSMPMAGIPFAITATTPVTNHGTEQKPDNHAETNGSIRFLNLASIIEFNVFSSNAAYQSETVQSITIKTSDGSIISGDGYLDLTQVSASNENSLLLNFSDANNAFDEIRVNQEAPVAATKGDATHIYMSVRPCNFAGTIIVTTDAASYTWTIPSTAKKELKRNYIYHYNMNLNNATRGEVIEVVKTLPYSETFTSNIGDFKTNDVIPVSEIGDIWTWGGASYGMKASAALNSGNDKYESESWLISPWISLENGVQYAAVSFDHVYKYGSTSALSLQILTNDQNASWTKIDIPKWSTGSDWIFVNTGDISLNSYVGKRIKLAFKYTSTTSSAATWEVKNFSVHETEEPQTADPVISFNASTKTVTITCPTEGAHIGYTTDGSTPGFDGNGPTGTTQEYIGPFTISETCTVKAFASADHMAMSNIVEKECIVPTITPASDGDVLWAESFTGFNADEKPTESNSNAIVYGGGSVNYACVDGGSISKIYTATVAGGTSPELLISKAGGSFSVFNIPTGLATGMTLTFKSNGNNLVNSISTPTENVSIAESSYDSDNKLYTVLISAESGVDYFDLTFTNTNNSNNVRVDNFNLVVGTPVVPKHTVTFTQPTTGGSFTVTADGSTLESGAEVEEGTIVTLTATAAEGYSFSSWTVDGATVSGNTATATFIMSTSEVSISALFNPISTEKKTYTLTITAEDFNSTSYTANNNTKTTTATASDNSTINVQWTSNAVMKGTGANKEKMQWQKSNGSIYNNTDLGTIKSVTVNSSSGSFTTYYGSSPQPSSGTTVSDGYFNVKVGNATGYTTSIIVVFEK